MKKSKTFETRRIALLEKYFRNNDEKKAQEKAQRYKRSSKGCYQWNI